MSPTRLKLQLSLSAAMAIAALCSACNMQLGLKPGTLDGSASGSFTGVGGATILSPSSVQVTWNASSQYSLYQVFSAGQSTPLGQSLFSSATLTGLTPNTTYNLSVGGTPTSGGTLFGADTTLAVQTWPAFAGVKNLTATSFSSLAATWAFPATGPTFRVYVNIGSPPTDFTTPDVVTQALSANLTTYAGGVPISQAATYFVVVRATYLDGTSESNTNVLSVTTPSAINPLPVITLSDALPGKNAVILGKIPTITVSGGLPAYTTTFTTGGVTLGSIRGNGQFVVPSSKPLSPGANVITATVAYQAYTAPLPPFTIVSRSLSTTFNDAPLLSSGKGPQTLGAVMAVGDFNCDGIDDLAVSAPFGTFFNAPGFNNDPSQHLRSGAVYVFYGGGPSGLILPGQIIGGVTIPDPSISPTGKNPLLLPFPNTSNASNPSQLFGTSLVAGNINGDTQTIGPNIYACDDLAIGSPNIYQPPIGNYIGGVFVYYGSPTGIQLGTPVLNGPACYSGVCSPQEILPTYLASDPVTSSANNYFGTAIALGNLSGNAGGFHDLIVSAPKYTGDNFNNSGTANLQAGPGKVFIYKSDSTGVTFGSANNNYATATIQAPATARLLTFGNQSAGFGTSLAAIDLDGDGRDDLLIGSPGDSETVAATPYVEHGAVYYYVNPKATTYPAGVGFVGATTAPTKQFQSGLGGVGYVSYLHWGGTITKAGDLNGDGFADVIIGTGMGPMNDQNTGFSNSQVLTVVYGSATGPQGFAGAPAVPVAPAINAAGCTTSCSGVAPFNCSGCVVQHYTAPSSWLGTPNEFQISTGLSIAAAKTQNNAGALLNFGGQSLHSCSAPACYADVAIGNPAGGTSKSGIGAVLYGSKNGMSLAPSLMNPSQSLPLDQTGLSAAVGVFKSTPACPTVASVALGSPFNSKLGNGAYGGVAYIFQPPVSGGNCALLASSTNPTELIKTNMSVEAPGSIDTYGGINAAPAGDLNHDGYTDVVASMNIPSSYPGTAANYLSTTQSMVSIKVGLVYYGGPSGISLSAIPSLNPVGLQPLLLAPPTTTQCGAASQLSCYALSMVTYFLPAGDINGDGFADAVMMGTEGLSIYYGSSSGLQHARYPSTAATNLDAKLIMNGALAGIITEGYSAPRNLTIVAGDFNGDGYSDLAYGNWLYGADPNNKAYNGSTTVIYGSITGYQLVDANPIGCDAAPYFSSTWAGTGNTRTLCRPNTALFGACDGTTPGGTCVPQFLIPPALSSGFAFFGAAVANVGDVNGDGIDDLLISSGQESILGSGLADAGVVYLYYGSPRGLWVSSNGQQPSLLPASPSPYSPVMITSPNPIAVGFFGLYAVSGAGDVNKDGFADFIISNPQQWVIPGTFGGDFLFYGCAANLGGCPNTGVWGVKYTAGPGFTTVPLTGGCTAGDPTCAVKQAPSCIAGGACSPLYFTIPTVAGVSAPFEVGLSIGTVGDINQDGYSDVILGNGFPSARGPLAISSAGYDVALNNSGTAVIFSGSPTGLVVGTPSTQPQCLAGQGCTPFLILPPYQDWGAIGSPEYINLTYRQSFEGFGSLRPGKMVDFNGDGLPDFFLQYDSVFNSNHNAYGMGGVIFFQ